MGKSDIILKNCLSIILQYRNIYWMQISCMRWTVYWTEYFQRIRMRMRAGKSRRFVHIVKYGM